MRTAIGNTARRFCRLAAAALLLAVLGGIQMPPAGAAAIANPPAPGLARIWIYRDYEPYETLARPYVRLNGSIAGISEPGGAAYRDVQPGTYLVSVDSDGIDAYQFATVALVPGQTIYVKIGSLSEWASGGGGDMGGGGFHRDTFYTRVMPPEIAAAEVASKPFYGGS